MKRTKLPMWYLVGVYSIILLSLISYFAVELGLKTQNYALAAKFFYFNHLIIITWFVINIIILLRLYKIKAKQFDFIFPIYFTATHFIYIILGVLSYLNIFYLSQLWGVFISIITTVFEFSFATYLIMPHIKEVTTPTKYDKRKTAHIMKIKNKNIASKPKSSTTKSGIKKKSKTKSAKTKKTKKTSDNHKKYKKTNVSQKKTK